MKSARRILVVALLMGPFFLGAAPLHRAAKRAAVEAARMAAHTPAVTEPVAQQSDAQLEQDILDQLLGIAATLETNLTWENQPFQAKKSLVEQLSTNTKERVFEHIIQRLMDNQIAYPFIVPQGTDYSQMDTFFMLIRSLMSHDRELCHKLSHCIGEKQIKNLVKKLDGCLDRVPPTIQKVLAPKRLNWQEKIRLANKINWRMSTKSDPKLPQTAAHRVITPHKHMHKHKKSFMEKIESVFEHTFSAFTGGVFALYAFLRFNHQRFEQN